MRWSIWTSTIVILVSLAEMSLGEGDRKISRCKVDNGLIAPRYELGVTYEAPSTIDGGPPMSVIHISIDPARFNRDDLLQLALKLKKGFCNEERLFAILFDDPAYIKRIYFSSHALFHKSEESKRGYYYVDRKTGEEYIEYCTVRNFLRNPEKKIRIELGPPPPRRTGL